MADFGASFVRVKLDLHCAVPHQGTRDLVWIVADRSKIATIEQFILLVRSQYGLPKEIELYLDDALLPHGEPTVILKDGDTVRSVGVIKQQSSSDSQGDNSPEPLPATDQPIKDVAWVLSESSDGAKVDSEPAVEVGGVVGKAWRDHPYTSKSTTDQSATPCFPAPQSTLNGGPSSSIPVHPKTMGTSVATPDSFLRGMRCRGKKQRRRRRPTKKAYVDKCTQTLVSVIFPPLASVRSPVQLGRQHCLGGNTPGDLQNNALSAPARKPPCIVHVAKSTKRAREQESLQAGKNGQDQQVPAKASRCSSAPRPPDIAMPEAES
ncbi:hypothetical protein HPB50_016013 [Hyalomma asiaticum]|uniref:Uncharacterized protein n=1 Tax=Hyalomma asiaticum TaxID=266040 RepID=A0ACB7TAB8_HYAAI|nr:hypothetical protein HPB50_016013 [Hyalomma asiaticum]